MKSLNIKQYLFLTIRVLLGVVSINYGTSKMVGEQFGLNPAELNTPIKDLSLFKVSWYLFGQEELYKYAIGFFQTIGGVLLLIKRTELIGAILLFPIFVVILIVDISFVKMPGFYIRIPYYLCLLLVIMSQYWDLIRCFFEQYFKLPTVGTRFPFWAYLVLPVICLMLEFLPASIITFFQIIIHLF